MSKKVTLPGSLVDLDIGCGNSSYDEGGLGGIEWLLGAWEVRAKEYPVSPNKTARYAELTTGTQLLKDNYVQYCKNVERLIEQRDFLKTCFRELTDYANNDFESWEVE